MTESELLIRILADQHDELLADFLSSAGAGVAFWTTLLDFEATSAVDRTLFDFALWELESAHTYDVHPIPLVRYRIFPEILAHVIGQCTLGPSPGAIHEVQAEMRNEVELLILPQFKLPLPEVIHYRNERAPADLQEISIPISLVQSFSMRCYRRKPTSRDWRNRMFLFHSPVEARKLFRL
jgi:hypothetical protein